jgi:hypothetical protein
MYRGHSALRSNELKRALIDACLVLVVSSQRLALHRSLQAHVVPVPVVCARLGVRSMKLKRPNKYWKWCVLTLLGFDVPFYYDDE